MLRTDDPVAADLRGFGPVGVLAILAVLGGLALGSLLSAALVLVWAWRSHTPGREIGYVRPRSWSIGLLAGVGFGFAFKLFMKAIVMPLLGAPELNQAYQYLIGNTRALFALAGFVILGGGFAEETVFRGYMFERLGKLLGSGTGSKILIVLITTTLFAAAHYPDQGPAGVEQAIFTGLVFGTSFAITGRLWTLMCAHAAFDLTALAIIYWNLEARVAHLVFT